jgi:hypothetical protein
VIFTTNYNLVSGFYILTIDNLILPITNANAIFLIQFVRIFDSEIVLFNDAASTVSWPVLKERISSNIIQVEANYLMEGAL